MLSPRRFVTVAREPSSVFPRARQRHKTIRDARLALIGFDRTGADEEGSGLPGVLTVVPHPYLWPSCLIGVSACLCSQSLGVVSVVDLDAVLLLLLLLWSLLRFCPRGCGKWFSHIRTLQQPHDIMITRYPRRFLCVVLQYCTAPEVFSYSRFIRRRDESARSSSCACLSVLSRRKRFTPRQERQERSCRGRTGRCHLQPRSNRPVSFLYPCFVGNKLS